MDLYLNVTLLEKIISKMKRILWRTTASSSFKDDSDNFSLSVLILSS